MSQQWEVYTYCSMYKQYVEEVQNGKKVYLISVGKEAM